MNRRRSLVVLASALVIATQLSYSSSADASPARPAAVAPVAPAHVLGPVRAAAAAAATPADYAYDAAGQLRGVSHTADGAAARYAYDDAGNPTAVTRSAAGALTVSALSPSRAPAGASVTVTGTGFAASTTGNTVRFNGVTASVTSATTARLVVIVPSSAASGSVTVTTGSATATSEQTFTVTAAVAVPTISAVSPDRGSAGTTVTLTGTGFSTTPADNNVSFGRTRARVTAATATSLTVTVPDAAVSAAISVATAGGIATSASDFIAITQPFAVADIGFAGALTRDGTATTVTFSAAGKVAVLRFAGVKGQRLSLGVSNSTVGDVQIYGYTPYGASMGRFEYDAPWQQSVLQQGWPIPVLPTSGTYQVVLKPVSTTATGSLTATLSSRVTGSLSLTGAGTTVNLARAGQLAELTLDAGANQSIGLGVSNVTLPSDKLTVQVLDPNGVPVIWPAEGSYGYSRSALWLPYWDVDFTTTGAGRYTILFGSEDLATGSLTVTASTPSNSGALTLGTPKSLSSTRPGQDTRLTFAGTAGQSLGLEFTDYTMPYYPSIQITSPDGSTLLTAGVQGSWTDLPVLPATGTYTVDISPNSGVGSYTVTLWQPQAGGTLSLTGAGTSVSFTSGRAVTLNAPGTAGQELTLAFSNWTLPASGVVALSVTDPSGALVDETYVDSSSAFTVPTATTGTYRVVLRPDAAATGSVTVTASPFIAGGALTIGTNKTISSPRLGQPTRMTFTGAVGQQLAMSISDYSYTYVVWVIVTAPSGSVLYSGWLNDLWLALSPLTVAGTYQLEVQPRASTGGSLTFALVQGIDAGATTVGGSAHTLTATPAGRYVDTTIVVTANQRLSFGFTGWTFASSSIYVRLTAPSGAVIFGESIPKVTSEDTYQLAAGTYRLSVMADDHGTGAVAVTVSAQTSGGAIALNTAKTVTASRAGQSTWYTYAGTANQLLSMTFASVTMPYYPSVWVRKPDGTALAWLAGAATVTIPTLPSTGTYEILISPNSATGSAAATLKTRTSVAAGTALKTTSGISDDRGLPSRPAPPAGRIGKAKPNPHPSPRAATAAAGGESWQPSAANLAGHGWSTGRAAPRPAAAAPHAPAGVTALSGRIRTLDDKPLANVTVGVEGVRTVTDANGLFLLQGLRPGHRVLRVDGSTANTPTRTFGLHDIGVDLTAKQTVVLPYTIWLSKLDTAHTVKFASPTTSEVTIGTPDIPGLEVKLPAGTVVRDVNGKVVTELGITAIPVDRTPFPLPRSQVPSYFTVQPGSSYVFPAGARVIYPNFTHAKPGAKMDFWHYDPAGKGWFIYGKGTVTPNGKSVTPAKGTEVYQFTGAMLITPGADPPPEAAPQPGGGASGADPVDLGTGLLVDQRTDLTVDDDMPLALTRTYQQSDTGKRAFGIGANFDFGLDLYSENRFYDCWLILPDGGRIKFHRTSPGGQPPDGYINAAFAADPTPTEFNGSVLAWNGDGWDLRLTDGTTYVFGDESPLQAIRDRFGNTITITRAPSPPWTDGITRARGPITQITSPNGKWIKLSYDSADRVTRAEDALGRSVGYAYDTDGHLRTVTDTNGGVTTYGYESGRLKLITDARGTVYLTNEYDANGRVSRQTMPGGATYSIAYTTDASNKVTATQLTDPRGHVRRVTFDAGGFATTDTAAYGTASAQTVTTTRDPVTHLPTAYLDALNRRTELGYDASGNVTSITEMAGTGQARTTAVERNGPFGQVSKSIDPLQHATTYGYQSDGSLHTVTDAMNRVVTLDTDESGQVVKVTDPAAQVTQFGYQLGELVSATDPLGNVTRSFADAAGRRVRSTDAQGNVTTATLDGAGQVRTLTDPLGRSTTFEYDANGNLHRFTDARDHATVYDFDTADRLTAVTDPLNRKTTYSYDANGNPATVLSAAGKLTVYGYDDLDRLGTARYGVSASGDTQESQATYSYDAGNRLRSIVDSAAGTLTVTPDDFDRPADVTDANGKVSYGYDAAGRRTTMTVAGQADTIYSYNDADQLTGVSRGSQAATIGYDSAGRRGSLSLPAGVSQTYGYDSASRLTGITYKQGSSTLGAITYGLDQAGRQIHVDGTYARVDLPEAYGPVSYDAADQRGGSTYDDDGNLTSDGDATYAWNARNELTSYDGTVSFTYDALGRRASRTAAGATTSYLYDGFNPLQEKTAGAVSATMLGGGLDETFARSTSGASQSLLTDGLGSTVATADGSAIAGEYTYDPFGGTTATGTDLGNPSRFTGREDDGNGLYYYRNRYYSPGQQRFISKDPLGLQSGDTNPYSYVTNQPTGLVDPMGTKPKPPRNCGGGTSLPDEDPDANDPRKIIEDTAQGIVDAGMAAIDARLSQAQWDAVAEEGYLLKIFRGSEVHKMTNEALQTQYPGRFVYRTVGPDFVDTETGKKIELTTPGEVAAHKRKADDPSKSYYDPDYATCDYATYKWTK